MSEPFKENYKADINRMLDDAFSLCASLQILANKDEESLAYPNYYLNHIEDKLDNLNVTFKRIREALT